MRLGLWIAPLLLGMSLLAGCVGGGPLLEKRVDAELVASKTNAWNGEPVHFSAANSTARTGDEIAYSFAFGDGVVQNTTEPNVTHAYAKGGDYKAVVTLNDAAGNDDSDSLMVVVNERVLATGQVVDAPVPPASNATSVYTQAFGVGKGAERFDGNITLRSTIVVGSSVVRVRVLDADNSTLVERNVTVDANQQEVATLDSPLSTVGTYTLEIRAFSGGAAFDGVMRVYYAASAPPSGSAP